MNQIDKRIFHILKAFFEPHFDKTKFLQKIKKTRRSIPSCLGHVILSHDSPFKHCIFFVYFLVTRIQVSLPCDCMNMHSFPFTSDLYPSQPLFKSLSVYLFATHRALYPPPTWPDTSGKMQVFYRFTSGFPMLPKNVIFIYT